MVGKLIDWRNVEDPPSGEKPFFWVAHAAAVNIGPRDSPEVEDFRWDQGGAHVLSERRYIQAMGKIILSVVAACAANPSICHFIFFPFGMGAYMRGLAKQCPRYENAREMKALRKNPHFSHECSHERMDNSSFFMHEAMKEA